MQRYKHLVCPVGVGFTSHGKTRLIRCGRWSCRHCRRSLALAWAQRANLEVSRNTATGAELYCLITLTLGRKYKTSYQGYVALPKLWGRLRKNMLRRYGSWRYMAFVEGQPKRGAMPHFHIISNRLPSAPMNLRGVQTKHALHDWAVKLGWGFEIDVSQVTGPAAGGYVAKYASKAADAVPRGFRRVRVSRQWAKPLLDTDDPLLVPAKDEDIAHFAVRVADVTGLPVESIYEKWTEAWEQVYDNQTL